MLLCAFVFSCNSTSDVDNSAVNKSFEEKIQKTMQALLESYANEDVDYSRFSENVVFKGTYFDLLIH